jgi:hypothetical protein
MSSVDEELVLLGIYGYNDDGTVRSKPVFCCECTCGGCPEGCLGNGCINRPPDRPPGVHRIQWHIRYGHPGAEVTIKHDP